MAVGFLAFGDSDALGMDFEPMPVGPAVERNSIRDISLAAKFPLLSVGWIRNLVGRCSAYEPIAGRIVALPGNLAGFGSQEQRTSNEAGCFYRGNIVLARASAVGRPESNSSGQFFARGFQYETIVLDRQ